LKVFFYGLFMDVDLLAKKGLTPQVAVVANVNGFSLHIGERATLLRSAGARAYGVMMEISSGEAKDLYAERSVADYVPEVITVELMDGSEVEASCYILPDDKITETNRDYAKALLQVAVKLALPDTYIAEIAQACV
jgi:hypothetical protein